MQLFTWILMGLTWGGITLAGIRLWRAEKSIAHAEKATQFLATLLDVSAARTMRAELEVDQLLSWIRQGEKEEE